MKICTKCHVEKPFSCFAKANKSGLRGDCKVCRAEYSKQCYKNNPGKKLAQNAAWRLANPEINSAIIKEWKMSNREHINAQRLIRLKNDPIARMVHNLRKRLRKALKTKKFNKNSKMAEIIGCTADELRLYLQNQFQPGMTWQNYGEWHVDHIIPLATANTEFQTYKLNHYTNLQPLWAHDNLKKSSKVI